MSQKQNKQTNKQKAYEQYFENGAIITTQYAKAWDKYICRLDMLNVCEVSTQLINGNLSYERE